MSEPVRLGPTVLNSLRVLFLCSLAQECTTGDAAPGNPPSELPLLQQPLAPAVSPVQSAPGQHPQLVPPPSFLSAYEPFVGFGDVGHLPMLGEPGSRGARSSAHSITG